jgi:cell division GTPase FtsZ
MSDNDFDAGDFDFADAYDDSPAKGDDRLLPENVAKSAISCGFIGVGGGGGKLAKAFIDSGFSKTLLINTTDKDQPDGIDPAHFVLVPGADGVGKDVELGRKVLLENSALVEDALRTRLGRVDWLFVLLGGGGGTGSAGYALDSAFKRYLKSNESSGRVFYVVTKPTAQELLNPTISQNYETCLSQVKSDPHLVLDNERQLQLLRGKVGMISMYPTANKNFAKLFAQVLKLASEHSPIQTFDSKDLEKCLSTPGRHVVGSTVVKDVGRQDLGASILQGCLKSSPCPVTTGQSQTGVLLLVATESMAEDPEISRRLESAFSYVGGRTKTMFSGMYIKSGAPGLVAIAMLGDVTA